MFPNKKKVPERTTGGPERLLMLSLSQCTFENWATIPQIRSFAIISGLTRTLWGFTEYLVNG